MKKSFFYLFVASSIVGVLFFNGSSKENLLGYQVGALVEDFDLPNIDGKNVSLADYTDAKGFIVIFTCNTCPYAKAYESRIIDLDKNYASKGYPVIAINPNDINQQPDDSMGKMIKRAAQKGYTFPYLRDDSQQVTKAFGATKTPHIYLINKEEIGLRVEYIGAIDNSPREAADVTETFLEDAIKSLMNGQKPTIKEKRAIGCTIKWLDA
ncbi:MAG: peroxiredoxin [Cyclobacteriaceae bacterium]|jgi:peroxiredoxin